MSFAEVPGRPVVLFDLDGTLLPMEMDDFMRAYFHQLCPLVPEVAPERLTRAVLAGTAAMARNDGSLTNREAFARVFTREAGLDFFAHEPRFIRYYETDFNRCARICRPTPLSRAIVDALRRKGYTVALATNPIFPAVATAGRLGWAGLSPADFALVTTYEDFRHAKPNPDYYRDVCARLAVRPEDCVMIGNDVEEDGGARDLGMEVLLVSDHLYNPKALPTASYRLGSLGDVCAWAEALPART